MPDSVKRGDTKTLRWNLGRDLTGVTDARVIISLAPGSTIVVDRNGTIEDVANGIVSLALLTTDYGPTKLVANRTYSVEIETAPGTLTHPEVGYEKLTVTPDLG